MADVGQNVASIQTCEQCGRKGTRGFKTLGPTFHEPTGYTVPVITICANASACMKRWPKPTDDAAERMYA